MLDEGAPIAAGEPFKKRGYQVIRHQEVLMPGAKDALVCATAIVNGAVLIATDRDMKRMTKRFGGPQEDGRYAKLHLIFVTCNEVLAAKRLEHAMSFIEHEWQVVCQKLARRLWLDIGPHHLKTYR